MYTQICIFELYIDLSELLSESFNVLNTSILYNPFLNVLLNLFVFIFEKLLL